MSQPHNYESWQEWWRKLSTPLLENSCGEDLKYDESFKQLKASSSGVGEINFKAMFISGSELLESKTKDVRVIAYTCLAATSEFGIDGLTYSLRLLNNALDIFEEHIHPLKPKARASVHHWFLQQQNRLKGIVEISSQPTPEQWHSLQTEIKNYGEQSAKKLNPEAGPLSALLQWLEQACKSNPLPQEKPPVQESKASELTQTHNEQAAISQSEAQSPLAEYVQAPPQQQELNSDSAYLSQVRHLMRYDKDEKNVSRLLMVSRAVRWSGLKLPPHSQGKTRLPAPRKTAFAPIANALNNHSFEEAFFQAETLFMEGAMHFNLNLQMYCIEALKKMGQANLAHWLEQQLVLLIKDKSELLSLKYEDGSEFCSVGNKEKLSELLTQSSNSVEQNQDDPFLQAQSKSFELVEQGDLQNALLHIDALPKNDDFSKARAELIKARVLLRAEHPAFAHPIFKQLLDLIECHGLENWQQDFTLEVWRYAKQCFSALATNADDEFSQQAALLQSKMLVTNATTAIGWI